jgi:uncharacterized protein (TIGR03790 family)
MSSSLVNRFLRAWHPVGLLACLLLWGCGGGTPEAEPTGATGSTTGLALAATSAWRTTQAVAPVIVAPSMPAAGLRADQLALVVAEGDPLSEAVALAYQRARGLSAQQIVRIPLPAGRDEITPAELAAAKARLDAQLPARIQATLLTFNQPSRVRGACAMSVTSALALGYDGARCGGCSRTQASAYFDSESRRPFDDLGWRPSMMLGAASLAEAEALIARGLAADDSHPAGAGWLVRTADAARSVRADDWSGLPALWRDAGPLALRYVDARAAGVSTQPPVDEALMFHFTGMQAVPLAAGQRWLPGAVADHLTSFGGVLPDGSGQMPATAWLKAGATGSYGTVEEPCSWTQKFPQVSVLLSHYLRGASLIEAYWKSVAWPGQGLFVGDPLARPWADRADSRIVERVDGRDWQLRTRHLRPGALYQAQWRSDAAAPWQMLAELRPARPGAQEWHVPLPAAGGQLRWLGPCAADATAQCVMGSNF